MHLDTRKVIAEVEKRPALWDPSDSEYCFVEARMESWKDVCRSLFKNFDDMDKYTRAGIVTRVRKRWNTARTAYTKVQKSKKNKVAAKRPYICTYYHRLVFLDKRLKVMEEKAAQLAGERIEAEPSESQPVPMIKVEEIEIKPEKTVEPILIVIENNLDAIETIGQDLPPSDNEELKQGEDDRAFLMSFLPMVKKLDEDQKLNFRLEAMRILIRVKNQPSTLS